MTRNVSLWLPIAAMLALATLIAQHSAGPDLRINSPLANSFVSGEVHEISGVGADPTGTLEIEVLTNQYWLQNAAVRVNPDTTAWTAGPIYLSGKGSFNNHTIRVTILKNGRRGRSVTVAGIVRR
jgi:hypothetical protein